MRWDRDVHHHLLMAIAEECMGDKAGRWDILDGDLSSDRSAFCIAMDRRFYFWKGVSIMLFPFILKQRCLDFGKELAL